MASSPWFPLFLFVLSFPPTLSSELGAVIGDGAASQLLRHAAEQLLAEPRDVEFLLSTKDNPQMSSLASLNIISQVAYRNLSLHFHEKAVRIRFDELQLLTSSNLSHLLWPVNMGDNLMDMDVKLPRGDIKVMIDPETFNMDECYIENPELSASIRDHWLADKTVSFMSGLLSPALDATLCNLLKYYVQDIPHKNIMKFPIHSILPEKAREFLAQNETNLFYRLKNVEIHEHQLTVKTAVEWNKETSSDSPFESNTTSFEMELKGDDRVTIWLEDAILNELINQVEWDFQWMEETVPVSSPIIPPDSREFLSTLCTECYFLLNVWAKGNPTIQATNNSLIFEKRDRVNLRVVNPDRNITSVFVAFVLTIQAELRPSFDNGILRTLVQLLDTNIEMESGAFPKNWALFMQDLMRGMILDMMWPEIKNAIEELSYGKGVRVSKYCGLDPTQIEIDIGEGSFALTTQLALGQLDIEKCAKELKSAIPNTSKLFQKIDSL